MKPPHAKRRAVSSASIFQKRTVGEAERSASPAPAAEKTEPHNDELKAYLALPQI